MSAPQKPQLSLDFDRLPHSRLAHQSRWWRFAMLFLSGTSLFLLLALLQVSSLI
ncbi:MAG: hypothetical protein AAFR31_18520 [Cyanobacteria bacterium J06627_8]